MDTDTPPPLPVERALTIKPQPPARGGARTGVVAATAAGVTLATVLGTWLWSRWEQASIDQRTRDRLAPRPAVSGVPSAAEIHVGSG